MSWITKSSLNWLQWLCVRILKCGRIPNHVAFIMDGNRRYAKKLNVEKIEGHSKGFDKLSETLQWCHDLGIKEVTVYAFSIENFKRTKDEVDALMALASQKFQRLLDERDRLMEHGIRIKVIGNWSLLPEDIIKLIAEAEFITKDNDKSYLNVAFAYTARDEMTHAMNTVVNGIREGLIEEKDVSSQLLSRCFHTRLSPEPELLIRTSGETRLSDYMLWQTTYSYLYFTDVLWPDFSPWDLMAAVFQYQRAYSTLAYAKEQNSLQDVNSPSNTMSSSLIGDLNSDVGITKNAEKFLQTVDNRYWESVCKSFVTN